MDDLLQQSAGGRTGVKEALQLMRAYPDWLLEMLRLHWARTPGDQARFQLLRAFSRDVVKKTALLEDWFLHRTSLQLPLALFDAVEYACRDELRLGDVKAVLAAGPPDNMEIHPMDLRTTLFADLRAYTGVLLTAPTWSERYEHVTISNYRALVPLPGRFHQFAMIRVPRHEGAEALWRPLVIGHELGHLLFRSTDAATQLNLKKRFPADALIRQGVISSQSGHLDFLALAASWVVELLCDAYTVIRFGPAGVAAISEFLHLVGGDDHEVDTHPPSWLRMELACHWVDQSGGRAIDRVVRPWLELTKQHPRRTMQPYERALIRQFRRLKRQIYETAASRSPSRYSVRDRRTVVNLAVNDIARGLPPADTYSVGQALVRVTEEDVINGSKSLQGPGGLETRARRPARQRRPGRPPDPRSNCGPMPG